MNSAENCDRRIKSLISLNISEEESEDANEEYNSNHSKSEEFQINSHRFFDCKSLPVTPRSICTHGCNGQDLNSSICNSFMNGIEGSSTPQLKCSNSLYSNPKRYHSQPSTSFPNVSHYTTCPMILNDESHSKCPTYVNYSSLPLAREPAPKAGVHSVPPISRPTSEPCIQESFHQPSPKSERTAHSLGKRYSKKMPSKLIDNHDCLMLNQSNSESPNSRSDCRRAIEMQWKFITTVVHELNKCRAKNNLLLSQIKEAHSEILRLKCSMTSYSEAGLKPGSITEMVRQIHAAQKLRDDAMMARIKLANEERDAAFSQVQVLMNKLSLSPRMSLNSASSSGLTTKLEPLHLYNTTDTETINVGAIEEHLRALKVTLDIDNANKMSESDDGCGSSACSCKGNMENANSPSSQQDILLEQLKKKLNYNEASRLHLENRCSKLEEVFSLLNGKANDLRGEEEKASSGKTSSLSPADISLTSNDDEPVVDSEEQPLNAKVRHIDGDDGAGKLTYVNSEETKATKINGHLDWDSLSSIDSVGSTLSSQHSMLCNSTQSKAGNVAALSSKASDCIASSTDCNTSQYNKNGKFDSSKYEPFSSVSPLKVDGSLSHLRPVTEL